MAARSAPTGRSAQPGRLAVRDDVGRRIREHREQSNLSLRELARRLGISPSAISQIETGKSRPSVSTLYAIVSELGMSLDELFSGSVPDGKDNHKRGIAPSRPRQERVQEDGGVAPPPATERHVQR